MIEQVIAQIAPNMGGQEAAVAGNQAVVFTAQDRKVIEERGGEIDKEKTFLEVLKKRPLTPEVENEETNIRPQADSKELKGRYKDHRTMLKHANIYTPREHVEINNELPEKYEPSQPIRVEPETSDLSAEVKTKEHPEIAKIVDKKPKTKKSAKPKAKQMDQGKAYEQMVAGQKKLASVKSVVKGLQIKRLFTESQQDFFSISVEIKEKTLAAAPEQARAYLAARLDSVTRQSAEYKLNLLRSLEKMALDDQHKRTIAWLEKTIKEFQ